MPHLQLQALKLEARQREELNSVLQHEESLWMKNSRTNWLQLGDRNTKYFHTSTLIRRRLYKIISLQDESRVGIGDQQRLKDMDTDFNSSLFSFDTVEAGSFLRSQFP